MVLTPRRWRLSPREASFSGAMVARKPGHQGERVISRKTIVQGMPGRFRRTCGDYRVLTTFCTRAAGATSTRHSLRPLSRGSPAPSISRVACALSLGGSPAPSLLRDSVQAKLGHFVLRERETVSTVIPESIITVLLLMTGSRRRGYGFPDVQLHIRVRARARPGMTGRGLASHRERP